jgi:hypothetical protein
MSIINKRISIALFFMLLSITTFAQCNCEEIKRDDGTNILQCSVVQVASDQTTQVGIGTASNGEGIFITLTVRFKNTAQNITKDLYIRLVDNNMISLPYVNSSLSYIGNSQVANGIFSLPAIQAHKFLKSAINTISFNLTNGLQRTYQVDMNKDVLENQIKCLPQFQTDSKLDELDRRNGFKSLQFGKSVADIYDFQLKPDSKKDGEEVYQISNPNLKIGKIMVKSIDCYFIDSKLAKITINLNIFGQADISSSDIENFQDILVENFGDPKVEKITFPDANDVFFKIKLPPEIFVTKKSWVGKKVRLIYREIRYKDNIINNTPSNTLEYEIIDYDVKQTEAKLNENKQFINSHKGDL